MGLDIYAGTLTRYYSRNWKTVTQQLAEAHGFEVSIIRPNGSDVDLNPSEIQQVVENWRDQILTAVTPESQPVYVPWTENNETPYYTDKPDWDAFGALLLYAACAIYKDPLPPTVEKNWDFYNHPVIRRMAENEKVMWSLFQAEWWLPIDEAFMFKGPLPNGAVKVIGTTAQLRRELEMINGLGWQAGEDTILNWGKTEGYPVDYEIPPDNKMDLNEADIHDRYDTESLAKFAFSILWSAAKFSAEKKVPILLDY